MLFTLTLGALLGIAGATLIRQWLSGSLAAEPAPPTGLLATGLLAPAAFPRLAPPRARRRRPAALHRPRYAAQLHAPGRILARS